MSRWFKVSVVILVALLELSGILESVVLRGLNVLTVYLHEGGHVAAAYCSGGTCQGFSVFPDEGGVTTTSGGLEFLILLGGYLVPPLVGVLLIRSAGTKAQYALMVLLSIASAAACFVTNDTRAQACAGLLILLFILAFVVGFIAEAFVEFKRGAGLVPLVLGAHFAVYGIVDIINDCLLSSAPGDASKLSEYTGMPIEVYAAFWLVLSAMMVLVAFKSQRTPAEKLQEIKAITLSS